MMQALFIVEQPLGNRTFYLNLRRYIDPLPELKASWVEVSYFNTPKKLWERLPLIPKRLRGRLVGRAQVRQGLRRSSHDVTLFHTQSAAALGGELVFQKPYLISMDITPVQHDALYASFGHPVDRNPWIQEYKHRKTLGLYQRAARLLPFSSWIKDSLVSDYQVDPDRIEVIPPGIDLDRWLPDCQPHFGPVRILFVGGDFHRKGGDTLLDAFRQLPAGLAELILVTKSTLSAEPGITILTHLQPNTPEMISLFRTSDIFVFPTRADSFGIAAVEASAAGLPVIATQVGAVPEIVVDGETGFIIPPDSPEALAQSLFQLMGNPDLRLRLGGAGRRHAEMHFDGAKNAAHTAELLVAAARYQLQGRS